MRYFVIFDLIIEDLLCAFPKISRWLNGINSLSRFSKEPGKGIYLFGSVSNERAVCLR